MFKMIFHNFASSPPCTVVFYLNIMQCTSGENILEHVFHIFCTFHFHIIFQTYLMKALACLASCPTWHGPDFTCNFPQTVLRLTETDEFQIYPKILLCFDFHLLVNISRCSTHMLRAVANGFASLSSKNNDRTS